MKNGLIVFSDGTVIEGISIGAEGTVIGGLTPYNGLTDYTAAICNHAFQDRIICMTYPLIGNVGVLKDELSLQPAAAGLIVQESIEEVDHWRSESSLAQWLRQKQIVTIAGADTRVVMQKLRRQGAMQAVLTTGTETDITRLTAMAQGWKPTISVPSIKEKLELAAFDQPRCHIAVLDLGCSDQTLKALRQRGCRLSIWPDSTSAADIMSETPDALLLSSGPEDAVLAHIDQYRHLLDEINSRIPVWGIDSGHLLIADQLGWPLGELSPGHHGVNYPVRDMASGRTYMTVQHHRHGVLAGSSPDHPGTVTHININDQTVEGLQSSSFRSVQFIPDCDTEIHQTGYIWDQWLNDIH